MMIGSLPLDTKLPPLILC